MSFTVKRSDLLPALAACVAVAEPKAPRPELACVLLEETRDGLRLRSSNGFQTVAVDIAAVRENVGGRYLVRAGDMLDRVSVMADGDLSVSVGERMAEVRRGKTRFSLSLFDPRLASFTDHDTAGGCKVSAQDLCSLLTRISPEVGAEDWGSVRSGVWLEATGVQLTAWVWNNVSLLRASIGADGTFECPVALVAVKHLRKLLAKLKGDVHVGVTCNTMFMRADRLTFTSSIPDTNKPPFAALIPPKGGDCLTMPREAFADAVRAVRVGNPALDRIAFRAVDGGVLLRGIGAGGETSEEYVCGQGTIDNCSLNGGHLSTAAAFHTGDELQIFKRAASHQQLTVDGDPNPVTVRDPGTDDLCVIMPMRFDANDLAPESPVGAAA